jgi:hypothetical protein
VEDEIIDQYLDGPMDSNDRKADEAHILQPPERQSKLRFARSLRSCLQPAPVPTPAPSPGWLSVLFASAPAAWALASVLAIVTVGAGVQISRLKRDEKSLQANIQVAQSDLARERDRIATLQSQAPVVVLNFEMVLLKSPAQEQRIDITSKTKWIEAHIPLIGETSGSYSVAIQNTAGQEVWVVRGLKPNQSPKGGSDLALTIPPNLMPPGNYTATVTARQAGARPQKYYCSVR